MRKKALWALIPLLSAVLVLSFSCKPITYYLSQVYKVYGKVTVSGSNGGTPIGSAEVFVGHYQYSELTNYYGDYEMEMAEGTWTINIQKDGYESYTTTVTVGPKAPRVRVDAELVWIKPVEPIDLNGYWDLTLYLGGSQTFHAGQFFIRQTDSSLHAGSGGDSPVFDGSIDGPTVTLQSVVGTLTGAVSESGDEISGAFTSSEFGNGTFLLVPLQAAFGHLRLSGTCGGIPVSVDNNYGQATTMTSMSQISWFDVNVGGNPATIGLEGKLLSAGRIDVAPQEQGGEDVLRAKLSLAE